MTLKMDLLLNYQFSLTSLKTKLNLFQLAFARSTLDEHSR
jgi:hypothetical protein